jgi:hypothetical protein
MQSIQGFRLAGEPVTGAALGDDQHGIRRIGLDLQP